MNDYLTRVAEAVRAACFEACNENGGDMGAICSIDLPAIIASVPRPEPVAWIIDWPDEPELGHYLAERPSRAGRSRQLYAEPVAAQPAVPGEIDCSDAPYMPADMEPDLAYRDGRNACRDAMLAAAPDAPEHDRPAQWWLAELDQYGNPTLIDGAHGQRAGANQAFYLNSALGLVGSRKYAVAHVELSEPVADGSNVNHDAVGTLRMAIQHNAAAPEAPQTIQCNACDWIGSSADALNLGGREPIGPLCPECHETTGPADDAATLRGAIRAMAAMLQAREWAEHVSTDPDVTDLEVQITELVGTATKLREQNASLVAALEQLTAQIDAGRSADYSALQEHRSMRVARAALASAEGGAA